MMRTLRRGTAPLAMLALLVIGVPLCSLTQAQQVSPYQTGHYYPGIMNIRDMAVPPPGYYVTWYNYWGNSGAYYDRNGNEVDEIPSGDDPPVEVNVSVQSAGSNLCLVWAPDLDHTLRYWAWISPGLVKGNTQVTFQPFLDEEVIQGSVTGFGDLAVAPVYIGYGTDRYDVSGGYVFYVPTGKYALGAEDNIGLGFWTHQFQLAGYLYFMEKATALMLACTYEFNGGVYDADFSPGNRFSVEYGLSQYVSDWLEVGVFGAHNMQVTEDTGDAVFWDPSHRDRKSGFGVSLGLWATDRLQFTLKKTWDYDLRQRFDIEGFQMNLSFLIGPHGS